MTSVVRLGVATLVATSVGCSLLIDVGGLEGGPADPGAEAGGDVALDAADSTTTPCAPPAFCDDFERADPTGAWNGLQTKGGMLAIDPTVSSSPTRSLRAVLMGSTTDRNVYLERLVPVGTLAVKVSFSFRVDANPVLTNVLAGLQLGTPQSSVFLSLNGGSLSLNAQNYVTGDSRGYPLGGSKLGEWDRISIELRRSTPSGTPTLRVTRGASATLLVDGAATVALGALSAYRIGIIYAAAGPGGAQAWFDDVRVDLD